jgi:peptide/nickel transport system permease protein
MAYLLTRLGQSVFLLIGVSLLSFAFLQLAPGNFFSEMRLNPQISEETVRNLQKQFALDKPLPVRYWRWLCSAVDGELGFSFAYNSKVAPLLLPRVKKTLLLTAVASLLAWGIAIPFGVFTASAPEGRIAQLCSFASSTLLATPELILAILVLAVAVRSGWTRSVALSSSRASHLILPTLVLMLTRIPVLFQHTASAIQEALASPYIAAARSHGVGPARILFRHALPAAANPLASLLGTTLASLLSGSLVVEVVFGWPGIGPLLLEAILNRDIYVVLGAVLLSAFLLIVGMFISDVMLFIVDPRIRTEQLA